MNKAVKKLAEEKQQQETVDLMGADIEAATDCGPVSKKTEKKEKEKAEQA